MNNTHFIKSFFCLVLVLIFITAPWLYSASGDGDQAVLENIGKQDPFEMIKPFSGMKSNTLQDDSDDSIFAPDLFVKTVMLKFLKAVNLEDAISSMSSTYGNIKSDTETNSLIVCDTKEKLEKIVAQIRNADQTPRQIVIEMVIVDVQLDDDTEIGVDWEHGFSPVHSKNYIQTLAGVAPATSGAAFNLIQGGISVTVKALQTTKDVEILASPRIVVLSGQEAFIQTIEEIPYTEVSDTGAGGENAITSTEFKKAGITLNVKATLTDEDQILLAINAEQSINAGVDTSLGTNVPIVDRRIAKTKLLMKDDQVLVMSGLRKKETKLTVDKVPLLGDLPILGALFSNDNKEVMYSELLIFISPHIYKDQPPTEKQLQRFNELKDRPPLLLPDRGERPEYEFLDQTLPSYQQ